MYFNFFLLFFCFHRQESSFHSKAHDLSASSTTTQRTSKERFTAKDPFYSDSSKQSNVVAVEESPHQKIPHSTVTPAHDGTDAPATDRLPPNVDPEVFRCLPKEIQMELLSSALMDSVPSVSSAQPMNFPHTTGSESTDSCEDSARFIGHQAGEKMECSDKGSVSNLPADTSSSSEANAFEEQTLSLLRSVDCEFPRNVDPKVFSELPLDVRQELMSEWKQKKPVLKSPSSRKTAGSMMNKDRRTAGKNTQANSLLKYFKPS